MNHPLQIARQSSEAAYDRQFETLLAMDKSRLDFETIWELRIIAAGYCPCCGSSLTDSPEIKRSAFMRSCAKYTQKAKEKVGAMDPALLKEEKA